MKNFMRWMEEKFVPVAGRMGSQRHLSAVRDGFIGIMPIVLAGSFAVLLNNTLGSWIPVLGQILGPINGNVWWGTLAMLGLLVTFSVGYNLSKSYGVDGLSAGLVSVASFIVTLPQAHGDAGWGYIHWGYLDARGIFTGLVVALIATEIFVKLTKKGLVIKMPDTVPPAVGKAFASVFPGFIAIFIFGALTLVIDKAGFGSLYELIFNLVQQPLMGITQGMVAVVLMPILMNLLWFFGIHGANIFEPIMQSVYLPALGENYDAIMAGGEAPHLITKAFFDSFVHIGGSGATLALIIAIFMVAKKRKEYREVAKLSSPLGLFQINESVIYGLPVVLNPILFIPFLLVPGVLSLIAFIATASGIVPPTYVQIPWITPVGIGAFLATGAKGLGSIMAALLAIVNLIVAVLIYLPFVRLAEKQAIEREKEEVKG
ncbi:PTS sugar transporter subunit IIC [Natronincola ferrireducens]|uniref:Permease IIC component n=1 Tax=Natronincola ferrireducens TaxID=393762 RepID=A0A1G8Z7I8_9FIRM|nr:PTS sugar transporter subunit IIC [Natronincola ferrireducens]SDK10180.1 PTS system, cellobiose-specific IIC component [Natronincola ferrireducens]